MKNDQCPSKGPNKVACNVPLHSHGAEHGNEIGYAEGKVIVIRGGWT